MPDEAKNYEIAYLISPDIAEEEVFGEAGKITGFIQDVHGVVGRIEEPKKRKLAYPIEKRAVAYFGWTTFTVAPEKIAGIEQRLAPEKNILRSLLVEEVKRPVYEFRARARQFAGRADRRAPMMRPDTAESFVPQAPKEEDKAKIEELDKRLEEILGK